MAVSVAVCDIFSVKEWPDLENRVEVRSRSLELAPTDRSHNNNNNNNNNNTTIYKAPQHVRKVTTREPNARIRIRV